MAVTTHKRWRRLLLHVVLIAGSALFAAPFVWLVSTSAKSADELYPPRWLPPAPARAAQSPYIALRFNQRPEKPLNVPDADWERLRDSVRELLRQEVIARADDLPAFYGPYLDHQEIADSVWAELLRRAPAEVFKGSAEACAAWFAERMTPEQLREGFNRAYRRVGLADLYFFGWDSAQEHIADGLSVPWKVLEGEAELVARPTGLRRPAREIHYDLEDSKRIVLQAEVSLAMDPANLKKLRLVNHADGTWHRIWAEVEMGGRKWVAEKPAYTGVRGWQETTWQKASKEDRTAMVRTWLVLADREASDYDTPGKMRITLRYERSGWFTAFASKMLFNYREVIRMVPLWGYVKNSVILVVLNILGQTLASSVVAFAFARLQWPGRDVWFMIVLATLMLPPQVTLIPVFLIYKTLGWYNTLLPLWVPAFFGNAFYIFLLRQFMKGIPRDLEDSARIDGCGYLGVYARIILPLMKPALAAIAIFTFMGVWNDFMGPLIFVADQELYPLSLGLFALHAMMLGMARHEVMMAASVLMTIPVVLLFFVAQRHFIQGITLTGMKG